MGSHLLLLLACVLAAWAQDAPPFPEPPTTFTAAGYLVMNTTNGFFRNLTTLMSSSKDLQMTKMFAKEMHHGYTMYINELFNSTGAYSSINGQCREASGKYYDYWSFLSDSQYVGKSEPYPGVECDRWRWGIGKGHFSENITIDVLTTDPQRVVLYNISLKVPQWPLVHTTYYWPPWSEWRANVSKGLQSSLGCEFPPQMCPHGVVENVTMTRYHSELGETIANRNLADVLGDASFVCPNVIDNIQGYQYLSQYIVLTNTSWGQYGACNNDKCSDGTGTLVGRESSYGAGLYGGQCAKEQPLGVWWSIPSEGECTGDQEPGSDSECSWKLMETVTTIEIDCLESLGFKEACIKDAGTMPYTNGAQVLEQALVQCPNVEPDAASEVTSPIVHSTLPARSICDRFGSDASSVCHQVTYHMLSHI